jgi:hypothetical protein
VYRLFGPEYLSSYIHTKNGGGEKLVNENSMKVNKLKRVQTPLDILAAH